MEYVYNWRFPWEIEDTLDLCAEVINAAAARSVFNGYILFENLWWPGSFRLDEAREYDYLLSRIDYPKCGIALDTGYLMNKNPGLEDENSAVDYLLDCIDNLGEIAGRIRTVHLTKSLSGDYIRESQRIADPFNGDRTFWQRLKRTMRRVSQIDRHDPFETPRIDAVLEKGAPEHVVFEFSFNGMDKWEEKIAVQKRALKDYLWPMHDDRPPSEPPSKDEEAK